MRKDIADINVQFPELASDLVIPDLFPREKFFSSVFRIASKGLQLWTHYDVRKKFIKHIIKIKASVEQNEGKCSKNLRKSKNKKMLLLKFHKLGTSVELQYREKKEIFDKCIFEDFFWPLPCARYMYMY